MGYSFIENQKQENSTNRSKSVASFLPVDPEWTLDQIVFSNSLKEQLSDIVSFCKNKEKIINDWELYRFMKGKGCIGINLWGIPGTSSVFQALGHGVLSLAVSVVRQLVVLLPVGFLLSLTGKLELVWWAFPIAELFSLTLCTIFLRRVYLHEIKPLSLPKK